jgi:mRNA interferase RelE/StbE
MRLRGFLRERLAVVDDLRSIGRALRGSELGEFWKYRV